MSQLKRIRIANPTGPHRVETEGWIGCAPFETYLGVEIVEAKEGRSVLRMPFKRELAQGAGLMHGGALVGLADTAVVMAIKSMVEPDTHFATISMESRFLRPVKKGVVIAKGEVLEFEGRLIKGRAGIYNEDEQEVFQFAAVFKTGSGSPVRMP